MLAITPGFAPAFAVLDPDGSVILEVANAAGLNIARRIVDLPGAGTFIVEVRSANNTPGQYLVSAQPGEPSASPTATVLPTALPSASPTTNPTSGCTLVSAGGQAINVRSGPGTGYSIIGTLSPGVDAPVIGRLVDNSWFQVNLGGLIGWVSATVVTLGENCAGIAVVQPPPLPPTVAPPTAGFTPTDRPPPDVQLPTSTSVPSVTPPPTSTSNPLLQTTAIPAPIRHNGTDLTVMPWGGKGGKGMGRISGIPIMDFQIHTNGGGVGAFTVRVCVIDLDPIICQEDRVASMDADSYVFHRIWFQVEIQGEHRITMTVDYNNEITETDEHNNSVIVDGDFG